MHQNQQKTQRKKVKPKKTPPKTEAKTVSITTSKFYWVTLTVFMVIFGLVYGYLLKVSVPAVALLLTSVLLMIGFAYYVRFSTSQLKNTTRATFIFVGASVIGFLIWAAIVLLLDFTGFSAQIAGSMSYYYFAITSLIICLISGAFIGDLIGKYRDKISAALEKRFNM